MYSCLIYKLFIFLYSERALHRLNEMCYVCLVRSSQSFWVELFIRFLLQEGFYRRSLTSVDNLHTAFIFVCRRRLMDCVDQILVHIHDLQGCWRSERSTPWSCPCPSRHSMVIKFLTSSPPSSSYTLVRCVYCSRNPHAVHTCSLASSDMETGLWSGAHNVVGASVLFTTWGHRLCEE